MTSTPDEDTDRTFARELFGSPADTEPDENRASTEDAGDTVDPDAREYARRLFSSPDPTN